jgi:hypothetical protein
VVAWEQVNIILQGFGGTNTPKVIVGWDSPDDVAI